MSFLTWVMQIITHNAIALFGRICYNLNIGFTATGQIFTVVFMEGAEYGSKGYGKTKNEG